jgi:alanyl-tRNA synthetase
MSPSSIAGSSSRKFGLPKDRLLATVYIDDDEAFDLWKKIAGLPESRIIRIAGSDNFWAMGDTGPCGPCSEIFYDHGEHIPGGPPGSEGADLDRFIEIWNLVFMQYEQLPGGTRVDLPKPSIDTGMGLERIAATLQGTHDNYETDLFRSLIRASVDATGVEAEGEHKASHRVIADHLRASSFLSPTACCRRTKGAAMCCGGSCAAPCAMRSCSARRIRSCTGSCRCWCVKWVRPIPNSCAPRR